MVKPKFKLDFNIFVRLVCVAAMLQLAQLYLRHQDIYPWRLAVDGEVQLEKEDTYSSAGNATLGFQSIQYIHLPEMFDKEDAIITQSSVSGIEMTRFEAVDVGSFRTNGKGLPPRSSNSELKEGEKACFRSHMEVWKKMVKENIQTMLIVEDDAVWDVNIRKIHTRIARGIYELNKKLDTACSPTRNDPYCSDTWDILSFGSCHDREAIKEQSVIIPDPDSPLEQEYFGTPLEDQRVVRKLPFLACTTAYALSLQGAKRLLLRASLDMDLPIDLVMGHTIEDGKLTAMSVYPQTMAQWTYREGIGAENLGSAIQEAEPIESDDSRETWKTVKNEMQVWDMKKSYQHARPRNPAFEAFRNSAYPDYPNF